jgi:uncharacterized protein YecE (DUF72 family)
MDKSFTSSPPGQANRPMVPNSVRVGTAGWNYRDWIGPVYPRKRPKGFHELGYMAQFFDVLEINTSFYGAVRPETARKWLHEVAPFPRFQFTAKLHQAFTHQMNPASAPPVADADEFRAFADTLAGEGKLGAVLAQFPWSFKNNADNRRYLETLLDTFTEYPMVVEARHSSWDDPAFWALLAERGAGFCNIDQPVIGRSLGPSARRTSGVGYVRLHGRNYKEWFAENGRNARYDYTYSREELAGWKDRVEQVSQNASATYVIANNHYQGQAAANALELISMLLDAPVPAPAPLVEAYPRLADVTLPVSIEKPPLLFPDG